MTEALEREGSSRSQGDEMGDGGWKIGSWTAQEVGKPELRWIASMTVRQEAVCSRLLLDPA